MNNSESRLLFSEIVNGYSKVNYSNKSIYIKHLDSISIAEVESIYFESFKNARKEGIPTEEERIISIEQEGYWKKIDEDKLKSEELYLDGLKKSLSKQVLLSQRRIIQNSVEAQIDKINKIKREKEQLIGITAEGIAERKRMKRVILISVFKDESFKERYFNEEEYDEDELDSMMSFFNIFSARFSEKNLKILSIANDFLMFFLLSKDSAYEFYGKPIAKLTIYQSQLFHHAKHYVEILKKFQNVIPIEVKNDPEKIIEWFEVKGNFEKMEKENKEKGKETNFGLVGATKEDMKALGLDKQPKLSINKDIINKKGSMSLDDFMKSQGQ